MQVYHKWDGERLEVARYLKENEIPEDTFRFLGIYEWENVYNKVLEHFVDSQYAMESGLYWSNIMNGFRKDIDRIYSFMAGPGIANSWRWIEMLPEIVQCDKVYLLLEDDQQRQAGHWLAECRPGIVNLIINDTYFSGDYYITDKKFKWLITENHHEIIHFIGKGLDAEVIKNICKKYNCLKLYAMP